MAIAPKIKTFDHVELIEPINGVPAGATGGVLELLAGDMAMVEITTPELDAAARIVFVPVSRLQSLDESG